MIGWFALSLACLVMYWLACSYASRCIVIDMVILLLDSCIGIVSWNGWMVCLEPFMLGDVLVGLLYASRAL